MSQGCAEPDHNEECFVRMLSLITELNGQPEMDSGLLEPIPVDRLDWEAFAAHARPAARAITRTKRLLLQLQPKSLRQQIYMVCEVISEDDFLKLRARWVLIGKLFQTTGDNVRSLYRNYTQRAPNAKCGRPRMVSDEQIDVMIREISRRACEKNPMTRKDIVRFASDVWGLQISKRTVNRIVKTREELVSAVALPMERARAEVTQEELARFYAQLASNVEGVLPESVVNMDEVGFSRRSRGSPLPCVIPAQLQERKIEYVPQEELDTTFTLIACVTLAGEALVPYIVVPVKSLPNDFLTDSAWIQRDCVLDFAPSGFANGGVVNHWYRKVFRSWMEQHRRRLGNSDAPIVLICDGFAGHANDEFRAMTAEDNVRLVYLPAHSSHLTQALDKFVFAIMKRNYNCAGADSEIADRNGRKIDRILRSFYSNSTSPMTIRASWKEIGIVGLRTAEGNSLGIEINGERVITQHVEMSQGSRYQRRRTNIVQDHLGNREALEWVQQGRCPHCGQHVARPDAPSNDPPGSH